jgi:hypothetical protein
MVSPERVIAATNGPAANIRQHWPNVYRALRAAQIASTLSQIGAIATIAIECPPWKPIAEYGEHPEYDTGRKAAMLGNTPEADGDGQLYEGRGFVQLTGRANYATYGKLLGLDLVQQPQLALVPWNAARLFAAYWLRKSVWSACDARDWRRVRKLVNGGYNHFDRFAAVIRALGEECAA